MKTSKTVKRICESRLRDPIQALRIWLDANKDVDIEALRDHDHELVVALDIIDWIDGGYEKNDICVGITVNGMQCFLAEDEDEYKDNFSCVWSVDEFVDSMRYKWTDPMTDGVQIEMKL